MILCFFIAALATVIESGVINTIDQGMLHNFCYFKDKFFKLCIFFHEQTLLSKQLLSRQEDESNIQISIYSKKLTFDKVFVSYFHSAGFSVAAQARKKEHEKKLLT